MTRKRLRKYGLVTFKYSEARFAKVLAVVSVSNDSLRDTHVLRASAKETALDTERSLRPHLSENPKMPGALTKTPRPFAPQPGPRDRGYRTKGSPLGGTHVFLRRGR